MYKVIPLKLGALNIHPDRKLEEELNKIAAEGWELVTLTGGAPYMFSVWKKK